MKYSKKQLSLIIGAILFTISSCIPQSIVPAQMQITGSGILQSKIDEDTKELMYFDLDTGRNDTEETADIILAFTCGSDCFTAIDTWKNAIGYVYGNERPNYDDCKANEPSMKWITIEPLVFGTYVCIKTNAGNISILRIDKEGPELYNTETIEISFQTWVE